MKRFTYDEIGPWSEVKLDIIRKYAVAYSRILSKKPLIKKHVYIDACAGAGQHVSKSTREFVPGSPLNALAVRPPFSEFHLIDLDCGKADELRKLAGEQENVYVHEGDANTVLLDTVFPRCRYEDYHRALCVIDPYALNINWSVLATAGQMESIEVFYNFMIMDANMNVLFNNPEKVDEKQASRMDLAWGDRSWRTSAYRNTATLFGDREEKAGNDAVAEAFRARLQNVAGFKCVPKPMPMRNAKGSVVYYLYFASPNSTGASIVEEIFAKYRDQGIR